MARNRLKLYERSTADVIALILTGLVVFVITFTVITGVVWKILDGDKADVTQLLFRVGNLVNTIVGIVAGYIAGRAQGADKPLPPTPLPGLPNDPTPPQEE